MRFAAIVNARAGTVARSSPQAVAERLSRIWSSRGHEALVVLAEGKDFGRAVRRACRDPDFQAVIIGGGDGSLSRSLEHVAGSGKMLGVLPLGTMNYMAREFGVPFDLEQAATLLADGRPAAIDLGRINDRMFLIRACLGAFPEFVRSRDKVRRKGGDFLDSVAAGLAGVARRYPLVEAKLNGPGGRTHVVTPFLMVSNNLCADADPLLLRRERLDGGVLGLYIGRETGPLGLAGLGLQAALGRWSANSELVRGSVDWLEVDTGERKSLVSVDGEVEKMAGPFRFDILPGALSVLIPRGA